MAGRLSFAIAINLLTENFKKGTNNVKNGFRSMQMQVLTFAAALGVGGLGLSDFVSRLITVARETSRVTTALKNVSGSLGQFADNQRFLLDMAKKYGLEINALTGNFAKFTAASQVSGMSMMNQRKIFESVSRAATAFGMSAEDSNGVFLALSQMMSKGKISSEELRLQMGERLPIALQAMAKAAGVSVAGLDKLLKQGKLMSADVLPRFADALNEMIPNVDTDNLETSINRLKNAFTKFTKETGIQNAYKGIIDWLTGKVTIAGEDIKKVFSSVAAFVVGVSLGKMFKWIVAQLAASQRAAMIAASRSAKAAGVAFDAVAWKAQSAGATVSTMFTRLGASMKSAFISALPTAILVLLSMLAAKLKSSYDEAKRIRSIFSNYKKESQLSGYTQEVVTLKQQLKIMNDKKQSQENINGAQAQLQKMLGVEHQSQKELNKLVAKRVELLKETAKADFHSRMVVESSETLRGVGNKSYYGQLVKDMAPDWAMARGDMVKEEKFKAKYNVKMTDGLGWENGLQNDLNSYIEQSKILKHSTAELEKSTVAANKILDTTPLGGGDGDTKKTDLQKAEEKYAQSLRELDARREVEKMSLADYNKAVDELAKNMLIEAKASGDKEILTSDYIKMLADVLDNPLYSETQDKLNQVEAEYTKAIELAKTKLDKKIISEDEYVSSIIDAATSAANSAVSIDGIGNAANEFIKKVQGKSIAAIEDGTKPILGKRDATFDYKKNDADKISGELDVWKKYKDELEDLKAKHKGLTKELQEELTKAIEKIPNLEQALKIAEIKEDVKQFSKELNEGIYSGVKDIASSADRLVSSFQALKEAFDPDSEASGWERLMAVWSAMTNVVDSFLSVAKMMENLTELTNKLILAKQTEATIDTTLTGTKVANAATQTTATTSALATQTTAEVAASATKSTAASVEMAAKSTAAYAAIPFVGVGLAAAQIAAMEAMIMAAGLPKFANGGIVSGGPTSGDKILARVNAGEMILNAGQQYRLFEAINSGRLGSSRNINIGFDRVRGGDILLSLNNTLKKQGKKPL